MKEILREELTPVRYGPSLIKTARHSAKPHADCMMLHWHDRMELIRLREGQITVGYGRTEVLLPGEIYIVPPKTAHYALCGDAPSCWDVVMFDVRAFYNDTPLCRQYLEPLFDGRAKLRMTVSSPELNACYDAILSRTEEFGVISEVYRLLALLFESALLEISEPSKSRDTVTRATEFMKDNLAADITTQSLAAQFGYSCEHFCRLFKKTTQFAPMQYLKIIRLDRAARLLKEGGMTITQVAAECGFPDANYFTRCFKAFFGKPPTQLP